MISPEPAAAAPDPESARYFLARLRQDFPSAYQRIVANPAALRCAVSLFSYSRFLSESVLRDPERLLHVAASPTFNSVLTLENYRERLYSFLGAGVPSAVDFARFRRRQLLRILLRDVVGGAPAPYQAAGGMSHPGPPPPGRAPPGGPARRGGRDPAGRPRPGW